MLGRTLQRRPRLWPLVSPCVLQGVAVASLGGEQAGGTDPCHNWFCKPAAQDRLACLVLLVGSTVQDRRFLRFALLIPGRARTLYTHVPGARARAAPARRCASASRPRSRSGWAGARRCCGARRTCAWRPRCWRATSGRSSRWRARCACAPPARAPALGGALCGFGACPAVQRLCCGAPAPPAAARTPQAPSGAACHAPGAGLAQRICDTSLGCDVLCAPASPAAAPQARRERQVRDALCELLSRSGRAAAGGARAWRAPDRPKRRAAAGDEREPGGRARGVGHAPGRTAQPYHPHQPGRHRWRVRADRLHRPGVLFRHEPAARLGGARLRAPRPFSFSVGGGGLWCARSTTRRCGSAWGL